MLDNIKLVRKEKQELSCVVVPLNCTCDQSYVGALDHCET